MEIRLATIDDAEEINRIYNQYPETSTCTFDVKPIPLQQRIDWMTNRTSKHVVLVATEQDAIVGWCSIHPYLARPAYQNTVASSIYLDNKHLGKGLGRSLMTELIRVAKENGFHTIIAGATVGQEASIRLHHSVGFEYVGRLKEVGFKFGEWHDTVMLQLMLQ